MAEEPIVLKTSVRKACPKCGELFKPSGLAGHLRFVHGLSGDAARKLWGKIPLDPASLYEGSFAIIDNIERVRQRRQRVKETYGELLKPEVLEQALLALDEQEKRLIGELETVKPETPIVPDEQHENTSADLLSSFLRPGRKTEVVTNELVRLTVDNDKGRIELEQLQESKRGDEHHITRDKADNVQLASFRDGKQLKGERAAREAAAHTKPDKTDSEAPSSFFGFRLSRRPRGA